MSMRKARWLWLTLLPTLLALATAAPAWAADPVTLQLQAPEQVTLGEEASVSAVLADGQGTPVRGATIILWSAGSFLSTGGAIELGRAATDAQGRATFTYQARSEGALTLNASFPGDSRHASAQASSEVKVQGSFQLYQEEAGVQVPGITVWLLVGLLGGVWSTYLTVMVLLTLIAREGPKAPLGAGGDRG